MSQAPDQVEAPEARVPTPVAPVFDPRALERVLAWDALARWLLVGGLLVGMVVGSVSTGASFNVWNALVLVTAALWMWTGVRSAKVAQLLPQIGMLVEHDPPAAEALLAGALRRWPLQRPTRLLLYHHLAVLRQRQGRWAEAAAVSRALLELPLGAAEGVRAHLLLLLAEASLQVGDLWGAYAALGELHRRRLSLVETLQRLALQTRYEAAAGLDAAALRQVRHKVRLAELMPASQGGTVHALLAQVAARAGQAELAAWLRRRAELLCTPEELAAVGVERGP